MNEPARSLSQDQQFALKSTYTFLCHVTEYLEAHAPTVVPEDQLHLENLLELGAICIARLRENFPECRNWQGGAS
jgi:hypothetical protein